MIMEEIPSLLVVGGKEVTVLESDDVGGVSVIRSHLVSRSELLTITHIGVFWDGVVLFSET